MRDLLADRDCLITVIVDENDRLDLVLYQPGHGDQGTLIRPDRVLVRLTAWAGI